MFKISLIVFFVCAGAGQLFSLGTMELVNSQTLDVDSVESLAVAYSSDNILVRESDDNNVILKEFMTRNSREYYAHIEQSRNSINIRGGKRPWLIRTRIELYIPKKFTGDLTLSLGSGNLTADYAMKHRHADVSVRSGNLTMQTFESENVQVEVSSGNINIKTLTGTDIAVENGSGNTNIGEIAGTALSVWNRSGEIDIGKCRGNIKAANRSGNVAIDDFAGEGTFDVGSGSIRLTANDITGDISLNANSGNINVAMNRDIAFILDAEVRSGNISAPGLSRRSNTEVRHTVGATPAHTIFAKAGSGNITVK